MIKPGIQKRDAQSGLHLSPTLQCPLLVMSRSTGGWHKHTRAPCRESSPSQHFHWHHISVISLYAYLKQAFMEFLEKTQAATEKRCQIESDSCPFFSLHLFFFLFPTCVSPKCRDRANVPKERITREEGKCGEKREKKGMVWGNVRAAAGLNWRSEKNLVKLKIKVVAATVNRVVWVFAQCCSIIEGNISTESQVGLSKEACL